MGGTDMANPWFVEIPANDKGVAPAQLEQVDFVTNAWATNSQQYKDLIAGKPIQDYGMSMIRWKGPFSTEAQARAAAAAKPSPNPIQGAENLAGLTPGQTGGSLGFLTGLTNRALWIRIAEGGLGVALILVGVAKLAEGTQTAQLIRKVPIF